MSNEKFKLNEPSVEWHLVGRGMYMYILYHKDFISPLGFVWGYGTAKTNSLNPKSKFEILGSYTVPFARRAGVRTEINKAILTHFDLIFTHEGSSDGGSDFMRATGYTYDENSDLWFKNKSIEEK